MDKLQYEQYCSVVMQQYISLDALKRIINHDKVSGWADTPGGLARIQVYNDCLSGLIKGYKEYDEEKDKLYGNNWPLPLTFKMREK